MRRDTSKNGWTDDCAGDATPAQYRRLLRHWTALGPLEEDAYWWFVWVMLAAEVRCATLSPARGPGRRRG